MVRSIFLPVVAILCLSTQAAANQQRRSEKVFGDLFLSIRCANNSYLRSQACFMAGKCREKMSFCYASKTFCSFGTMRAKADHQCSGGSEQELRRATLPFYHPAPSKLRATFTETTMYNRRNITEEYRLFPKLTTLENRQEIGPNDWKILQRITNEHNHSSAVFQFHAVLQCAANRFGPFCETSCFPSENFTCGTNGTLLCMKGWTGPKCEDEDRCNSVSCLNGGTCDQSVGCICPPEFSGDACEVQKNRTTRINVTKTSRATRDDPSAKVRNRNSTRIIVIIAVAALSAIFAAAGIFVCIRRRRAKASSDRLQLQASVRRRSSQADPADSSSEQKINDYESEPEIYDLPDLEYTIVPRDEDDYDLSDWPYDFNRSTPPPLPPRSPDAVSGQPTAQNDVCVVLLE